MDIRQLEFFMAVAEERNFTRAAEVSYVTQSGMSASVRALERELGVQLFNRTSKEVTLTAAGRTFLPRARRILEDARGAQRELLSVGTEPELVRVGSVQCVGDLVDLVDLLASFRGRERSVEVALVQASSALLAEGLRRSELDVALLTLPVGESLGPSARGVSSVELRREPFVLVVPQDHDLAARDLVNWADLESLDFVDFSDAWVARVVVDNAFSARRRIIRHTTMTVDDVHMLLDLVGRGLGAAILPESFAAKPQAAELAKVAIAAPDLAWQVHVALSDQAGPAAQAFAGMLIPARTTTTIREQVLESACARAQG